MHDNGELQQRDALEMLRQPREVGHHRQFQNRGQRDGVAHLHAGAADRRQNLDIEIVDEGMKNACLLTAEQAWFCIGNCVLKDG